jgi:hypothetical protein
MTAVEFLVEELKGVYESDYLNKLVQKAKAIEKQQIMNAVYDSMGTNIDPNMGRAEEYYNETFKNTKE